MYGSYPNAAKGLKWMFIAQILTLISVPLMLIFIGTFTALAATVLNLVGLYTATHDDAGYFPALYAEIASLVISVLSNSFVRQGSIAYSLLSVVSSVIGLFIVYQVVTTTLNLLNGRDGTLALRGGYVIRIYVICTLVAIVCSVLVLIPILNMIAMLASVVAAIAMVVGYVFYLMFLYGASKALV